MSHERQLDVSAYGNNVAIVVIKKAYEKKKYITVTSTH